MTALAHDRCGSGEPLVLIHGIGSQRQVWGPVMDRLTPQREVVALDLPGFGDSPVAPDAELTPAGHARYVAALLDELGLKRPHVAGNSLGGGVALELARMGRARSATGLSPVGFWTERERAYSEAVLRTTFV
ncbi:MAG: alpha/beta fold hydrolase, partial [Actinomycetota bacterium]|nr:alpha/beta fold hydrolase [Actinomycetota bacterium]